MLEERTAKGNLQKPSWQDAPNFVSEGTLLTLWPPNEDTLHARLKI